MKKYPCLPLKQGTFRIIVFTIRAKELFDLVKINRREEDRRTGYQRALAPLRTKAIAKFIDEGNAIPTNIVVALDKEKLKLSASHKQISISTGGDAGWVIDGQHRLAGASEANDDIQVAVTAFIGLTEEQQVTQFITINKEAKKVPTSLWLDLLPDLKNSIRTDADLAKERAVDLANQMKIDEESPFFNRIVSLKSPSRGQISLTNFVRKISPFVHRTAGILRARNEREQRAMLENYYWALSDIFPKYYDENDSIFFKTVGFGGAFNAFTKVHDITLRRNPASFVRADVAETLKIVEGFDFGDWKKLGSGSAAEIRAGMDLTNELESSLDDDQANAGTIAV